MKVGVFRQVTFATTLCAVIGCSSPSIPPENTTGSGTCYFDSGNTLAYTTDAESLAVVARDSMTRAIWSTWRLHAIPPVLTHNTMFAVTVDHRHVLENLERVNPSFPFVPFENLDVRCGIYDIESATTLHEWKPRGLITTSILAPDVLVLAYGSTTHSGLEIEALDRSDMRRNWTWRRPSHWAPALGQIKMSAGRLLVVAAKKMNATEQATSVAPSSTVFWIDVNTGGLIREHDLEYLAVPGALAVDNRHVYLADSHDHVRAFSIEMGIELWSFRAGSYFNVSRHPVVGPRSVFWYGGDGAIRRLDKQTGVEVWRHELHSVVNGDPNGMPWGKPSPVLTDDAVIVVGDDVILALSKRSGKQLWWSPVEPDATITQPVVVGSALVTLELDTVRGQLFITHRALSDGRELRRSRSPMSALDSETVEGATRVPDRRVMVTYAGM